MSCHEHLGVFVFSMHKNHQQRGSPLRKYLIPGCIEMGLVLDLRVCSQAAPAACGNLGFCPLGIVVEEHGFRTAWLITGQKVRGVWLKLKAFILTFRDPSSHLCQKNIRVAIWTDSEFK